FPTSRPPAVPPSRRLQYLPPMRRLLVIPALLAACASPPPPPEPVDLAPAADSVVTPWTDVSDAAWLGERRWAVIAPGHAELAVAGFASGTLEPLAGARKDSFRQPYAIFRALDSLHVADWEARALTTWDLAGRAGGRIGVPAE